jgi:DNA-directed RNA polymerase subunit F
MMVRKIIEEKPIPLGQVYKLLQIREEEGINYVQRLTAQHAEKLSRNAAYSEKVIEALQKEFNISRILVVQLVNINPKTAIDVRTVTGDRLTDEQIEKFLERYSELIIKQTSQPTDSADRDVVEETESIEEDFEDL